MSQTPVYEIIGNNYKECTNEKSLPVGKRELSIVNIINSILYFFPIGKIRPI